MSLILFFVVFCCWRGDTSDCCQVKTSPPDICGAMKIAQIITRSDTIGGAQNHVLDLCCELRKLDHQVQVFVGGAGPFREALRAREIPVTGLRFLQRPLNPLCDAAAFMELLREIRHLRPDLIACHSSKAGLLGRLVARVLRVPVVFTAHGWSFTEGISPVAARLFRGLEKLVAPLSDKIICVSERDRVLALEAGICAVDRLQTIHNGVADIPAAAFADPLREPVRLMMVARLDRQKNHGLLLDCLAQQMDLNWTLDLVGDGPLASILRAQVEALGLSERVRFLGFRQDVVQLLAQAQLAVLCTHWEGLPLTILEAMRAGLPVVASHVGGVGETIIDGETGFLVPVADAGLWSERLRTLITQPDLRQNFGAQGRQRYLDCFTLTRMTAATLDVYQEVFT